MEMVAWLSGLTEPGEDLTLDTVRTAVEGFVARQAHQGIVVTDVKLYGSLAMVDRVFDEDEVGTEVEGVGEVWTTEVLDPVADFQVIWLQETLTPPPVPTRRQRTRRR